MATVKWPTRYDERDPGAERSITAEPHTIGEDLPNVVLLFEVPLANVPSTVSITQNGTAMTEVTGIPAQGEFKVIYTGNLAGRVEFNGGDNGAEILVDYKGRGSNMFARDVNNLQGKKLDADGTMAMSGPMDAPLFKVSGTTILDATMVLQNVTLSGNLITSGTVADARLSPNVALQDARPRFTSGLRTDFNLYVHAPSGTAGWARGMRFLESGAVGFNDSDPAFGGIGILGTATGGTSVIQRLYMAHGTQPWLSNLGVYILPDGKTGIMKTAPSQPLDVAGNGNFDGSVTAASFVGVGTNLTALSAANITSGTLADARLSTNVALKNGNPTFSTGMTVQGTLTAQGPVVVTGPTVTIGNAVEHIAAFGSAKLFRNLCALDSSTNAAVGALVIKTGVSASAGSYMMRVRVQGYLYDNSAPFDLLIGFYHYTTPTPHTWNNAGFVSTGTHQWQVRLAETSDGYIAIILDDVASQHNYPKLWVSEALVSYNATQESYGDGWSISLVTDLSSYSLVTTVGDRTQVPWYAVSGTPTTLAGYGITDAASLIVANNFGAQQTILRAAVTDTAVAVGLTGDTQARLAIAGDGKLAWGPGGTTGRDTNLYRSSANVLATDDTLLVKGGNLQLVGATNAGKVFQIQNYAATGYHTINGYTNLEVTAAVGGSVTVKADAAKPTFVVLGQATQSADLQQWQSSSGVLSVLTKDGWLGLGKATASTALDVAGNGTFSGNVSAAGFYGSGANLTNLPWANVTGRPTTLGGYGISDAVATALAGDWNIVSPDPQFVAAATNAPPGGIYFMGVHIPDTGVGGQNIAAQFAGRNGAFYGRTLEGGVWGAWNKFWHDGNDGANSTLDADLLDGQHGSYYQNASNINAGTLSDSRLSSNVARLNAGPTFTSGLTLAAGDVTIKAPTGTAGWAHGFAYKESDNSVEFGGVGMYGSTASGVSTITNIYLAHGSQPYNSGLGVYVLPSGHVGIGKTIPGAPLDVNGNTAITGTLTVSGTITQGGTSVALVGASYTKAESDAAYAPISRASIPTYDGGTDATTGRTIDRPTSDYQKTLTAELKTRASLNIPGSGTYATLVTVSTYIDSSAGATVGQLAFVGNVVSFRSGTIGSAWAAWNTFWHNGNDGAGSTLDADLLDGQQGSYYQNATNINAGTLADARLTTNVPLKNATNAFTGANSFTTAPTVGGTAVALVGASYTKAESDGRYLKLAGGTLTGAVTMANINVAQIFPNNSRLVGTDTTGTQSGELMLVAGDNNTYITLGSGNTFVIRNNAITQVLFQVDGSGNVTATGDVTAFSDRRKKTDLVPLADVSPKLQRLMGYLFTRTDTAQRGIGLIAQDVQALFPEAVHTTRSGELTLAYGNLVAPLVVAHNEHSTHLASVDAELAALRARVAHLESRLQGA